MINLFGEVVSATKPKTMSRSLPVAQTYFRLATWYAPGQYWKTWPDEFGAREDAERQAEFIEQNVRGHTHYTILEIHYPGL